MKKIFFSFVVTWMLSFCTIDAQEIIRPEDQGEDFSLLSDADNFKRLTTSADKFERWKAAKVLGTRFIE
ncbi:MAG: hypothetical protein LBC74_10135, partial [Planctomycetaceae bacterium]|nr:hypothetical protein [Planctomycetaceae bacterium]